jgi:site-specific recombinase XerC
MSTGWLLTNPTDGLKKPVAPRTVPSDYFDRREFQRILNATYEAFDRENVAAINI